MAALTRGEVVDVSNPKLDVYIRDSNGVAVDVYALSYCIFERVTAPGESTQVYPTSGEQPVNLTADRVAAGVYAARFTVPSAAILGTWAIRWTAKLGPNAPEQHYTEEFEVLSGGTVSSGDLYITVADVRAAGVNARPPEDSTIYASIKLWQQVIERATRNFFRPVPMEFYLDGPGSDTIFLPVPIISLESLRLNGSDEPLETGRYRVYSSRAIQDDRGNPRIKLIDQWGNDRDIYTAPDRSQRSIFRTGRQNQYIKGVFGYVEPDGSPPELIKRALLKLVLRDLGRPLVGGGAGSGITPPALMTGVVTEEWTDGHQIKYAVSGGEVKPRAAGLAGLIDDPEVQMILKLYRAPMAIGAPSSPTWY